MNENQWLFLWRSPTSGFCVKDICYSGPRAVLCCRTNGRISKLAEIDPHVSKQTAQYEFNEGSAIVCVTCARGNNQILVFDDKANVWLFDRRTFSAPTHLINSKVALGTADSHEIIKKKKNEGKKNKSLDSEDELLTDYIEIWDIRNTNSALHSYSEYHSDSIQALSFSAENPNLLMSGDANGLVNIIDVSIKETDDALQSSSQLGSSVSHVNFLSSSRAYATSDDNRFQVFRLNKPDDIDVTFKKNTVNGEFLVDILDINEDTICSLSSTAFGLATVNYYSTEGKKVCDPRSFGGHEDLIRCSLFNAADRLLIMGDESGCVTGRELLPITSSPGIAVSRKAKRKWKPYAR
ncbi:unnamed protein product [Enterobius vermicularis]|uniref:WD repeat-containing protein 89 n=1 Tax=Enterobius vermicularis TaxID=51028 RepID=A0A0N4VBA0_ENTVE|nr:unnamed protein product [Enterobius vermicularis]